jgi:hypothetical protein
MTASVEDVIVVSDDDDTKDVLYPLVNRMRTAAETISGCGVQLSLITRMRTLAGAGGEESRTTHAVAAGQIEAPMMDNVECNNNVSSQYSATQTVSYSTEFSY